MIDENFDEIHELLLKRLDDSQDSIRIEVCTGLEAFFKEIKPDWSMEKYEKMVKTLFVHYDDPNGEVRKVVGDVLKAAAGVHKEEFLNIVSID